MGLERGEGWRPSNPGLGRFHLWWTTRLRMLMAGECHVGLEAKGTCRIMPALILGVRRRQRQQRRQLRRLPQGGPTMRVKNLCGRICFAVPGCPGSREAVRAHLNEHCLGRCAGAAPNSHKRLHNLTQCSVCSRFLSRRFWWRVQLVFRT